MAVNRYVLVPDDLANKVIVEGPVLWDPVAEPAMTWPAGTHPILESQVAAGGYTWAPPPVADTNKRTLVDRAAAALASNAAFLAIVTPTNAQVVAQVRLLTRECTALIRLAVNQLDTTDGT